MDNYGVLFWRKLCGFDETRFDPRGIYHYNIKRAVVGSGILAQ